MICHRLQVEIEIILCVLSHMVSGLSAVDKCDQIGRDLEQLAVT